MSFSVNRRRIFWALYIGNFFLYVMCMNTKDGSTPSDNSQGLRLPKDIKPRNYKLDISLKESTSEFMGNVKITADVIKSTKSISFHRKNMKLNTISLHRINEKQAKQEIQLNTTVEEINKDENPNSIVTIHTKETLKEKTQLLLEISYTANVSEDMAGFYKSEEKDEKDKITNCIYSTQFEATSARLALPCWDEPEFKSTFDISITAPTNYTVLSNGKISTMENLTENTIDKDTPYTKHTFNTTPVMSTYLVAWVIGEMDYVEDGRIRVYTPKGQKETGRFSLDVAVRCLSYFEEYFGIEYQMDKLDMVAIPNFSAGAMENWGLVTYRSSSLLYIKNTTTEIQKLYIAETVCHELAHQWFGNLVTMKWWNDLWLNEGFATWAGTLATAVIAEEIGLIYNPWVNFLESDITEGMIMDGKLSTHPINVKVESAGEISSIFDAISYHKGGSIIHMLSKYVGESKFRDGLRKYIAKYKYDNTETKDLWREIDEGDGKITEAMINWIDTPGFPRVTVEIEGDRFLLKQTRYLPKKDAEETEKERDEKWMIFLTKKRFTEEGEQEESILFPEKELRLNIDGESIFNVNSTGFYILEYSEEVLQKHIIPLLESDKLSDFDRFGIFRDVIQLTISGYKSASDALSLFKYIKKNEKSFVVGLVSNFLEILLRRFSNEKEIELAISTELSNLLQKYLDGVNSYENTPEDEEKRKLRIISVGALSRVKDSPIQKEIIRLAQAKELSTIHKDYRSLMYLSYAKYGGKEAYEYLNRIIQNKGENEIERLRAISAISYCPDEIDKVFEIFAKRSRYVKNQDKFRMVVGIAQQKDQLRSFRKFKENFKEIVEIFEMTKDNVARFVEVFIRSQLTREGIEECRKFFEKKENIQDAWVSAIKKGFDEAEVSFRFYEENKEDLKRWAGESAEKAIGKKE